MLRTTLSIVLASSVSLFACGGSSKSSDNTTTPVASTPSETPVESPPATPTPEETGTPGAERQNVAGMQPATTPTPPADTTATPPPADTTGTATADKAKPDAESAPISEANVFAILTTANEGEIALSKLALKNSKNAAVKKFAKMMVTEHGKMLKNGNALAKKLAITPEPNDDVQTLKTDGQAAMDKLSGLKGAEFDAAFADQMVQDHDKVLSLVESRIKPAAQSPELVKALDADKPKIEHHLDEAKNLQGKLASATK